MSPASRSRLTRRDRLRAWLVTGRPARAVAFFLDLAAFAWSRIGRRH